MTSWVRSRIGVGVLVPMMLGVVGCRQPDGEIPPPTEEQMNQIGDIARDLQNVAAGRPKARLELADDLYNLADPSPPRDLADRLSDALEAALAGRALSEAATRQVADLLFVVSRVRQLSERQIDQMANDLEAALVSAGANEDQARAAAAAAHEVQTTMTVNRRRWYELL